MAITHQFVVAENEEFGTTGLRMKGRPHFDPFEGLGTAHDMLEHFTDDDGSVEHELLALGASLFVRGNGAFNRIEGRYHSSPGKDIGSDMTEQHRYMLEQGRGSLRDPGNTRPLRDADVEASIQAAYRHAIEYVASECDGDTDPAESMAWLRNGKREFVGWLRRGYRRAVKRYASHNDWHMVSVFQITERAVNNFLKDYGEMRGTEVTISIDVARQRVRMHHELEEVLTW